MNQVRRRQIFNTIFFTILYGVIVYIGFILPDTNGYNQGVVRGAVVTIPLILLFMLLTIGMAEYKKKHRLADVFALWRQVGRALLSIQWWNHTGGRKKKERGRKR